MQCSSCQHVITPGLEIACSTTGTGLRHCPYCLAVMPGAESAEARCAAQGGDDVSVGRLERRRSVRGQFVDRLLQGSVDGVLHCPVCEQRLNKNDELLLRSGDYFRCPNCAHDLATVAYREVAYDESRWLPVLVALADFKAQPKCAGCAYLGAVARSCQQALSWIPKSLPAQQRLLSATLARSDWRLPDCDWSKACMAVQQYRNHAAEGLALL
ncbi:MAG: hypothetical protein HY744_11730 [Deltaproteobacteria bacterium]|nr:hypothetical protein [Deltaproteobacteria bacterium]